MPNQKKKSVGHFNGKDNHKATVSDFLCESDNHKKDSNLETYEEAVKKMLHQHENMMHNLNSENED